MTEPTSHPAARRRRRWPPTRRRTPRPLRRRPTPERVRPPVQVAGKVLPGLGAVGHRRRDAAPSSAVLLLATGFNLALFVGRAPSSSAASRVYVVVARRRGQAARDRPRRHVRRRRRVRAGADAARLPALHRDLARRRAVRRGVLHVVDARRDRRGRRRHPRDLRHADHHRLRDADLGADRHPGRDLPAGVRHRAPEARADVLRRRHDRHPVDRRRPVRLRAVLDLLRAGHPPRHHGLGRAVGADDPDRRALHRGDAADRARTRCARRPTRSACPSGGRSSRSCCRRRSAASSPASCSRSRASSARPRRC